MLLLDLRRFTVGFVWGLLLWLGTACFAQQSWFEQVAYRQIASSEGLPSLGVYSLIEDADGWIYVGTSAGLFRYDGVSFVAYTSSFSSQPDVHNLKIGPDNRVYGQNFRGQVFRVEADSLQLVGSFDGLHPSYTSYAFADDSLYVAVADGIRKYPLHHARLPLAQDRFYRKVHHTKSPTLFSIFPEGAIFRGPRIMAGKIGLKDEKNRGIDSLFDIASSRRQGDSCIVTQTRVEGSSALVAVTVFSEPAQPHRLRSISVPASFVAAAKAYAQTTADGNLLVGGVQGLLYFNRDYEPGDPLINLLPGSTVQDVLVDRNGMTWVATASQGLLLIPDLNVRQHNAHEVHAPIVELVATADDVVLFGRTQDGSIYQLMPHQQRLSEQGAIDWLWTTDDREVFCGPVRCYPQRSNLFTKQLNLNYGSIKGIVPLPDGALAMATSSGPVLLNAQTVADPTLQTAKPSSFRDRRSNGLVYDADRKRLIVSFTDGLHTLQDGQTEMQPLVEWPNKLVGQSITLIDDQLLVGTTQRQLLSIDLATHTRRVLLEDVDVRSIALHGDQLWLSTDAGILRSDTSQLDFRQIDQRMGLPAGQPTAFCVGGSYLYAVYGKRIVRIDADQQAYPLHGGTITFASQNLSFAKTIATGGEQQLITEYQLDLEADRESLRLRPRLPNYSQAPGTRFEYRFAEADTTWQIANGDRGSLYFRSLQEGKRALDVRLYKEPSTVQRLKLNVRLPWWRQPWPYFAALLVSALVVIMSMRRRAARRQAEAERQTALRESQLTALAAQMNPHFIFNALNSVQDFMMSNDRLAANDYLSQFATLIRMTLDCSRKQLITLSEELDMIETYLNLERIRFDHEIDIQFVRVLGLRLSAKLPPLIVQPYIENSFKHGLHHSKGERKLLVRYEMQGDDQISVVIEDNGVGRARAAELARAARSGNGFATGATAQRLLLLNNEKATDYQVTTEDLMEDGKACGTRVSLLLQLSV